MKKIGIIPLRKGSKGIKNKNRKKLLGRPLFSWVLSEAVYSNLNEVYVFTDDEKIKRFVENEYKNNEKVKMINRAPATATDVASTETALIDFSKKLNYNFDMLCLLQATSPLTKREDINKALKFVEVGEFDSAVSTVRLKRFTWGEQGIPDNYDYNDRPRRQDFKGLLIENGAIYVTTKNLFTKTGVRLGGKIALVEMKEDTFFEIDSLQEWQIVETLLKERLKINKINSKRIKALFLDVDGVFTEGKVIYTKDGEYAKSFSLRDGMGLELLRDNGVKVFVITSENSKIVEERMKKLNIYNYYLDVKDKYFSMLNILQENDLKWSEIAYIGDDINDIACMASAGWGIAPIDCMREIYEIADIIMNSSGGNEVIREATNFIIKFNQRRKN